MTGIDAVRISLGRERARTIEQIDALELNFDDFVDSTREVATDDEHDPEGHTIAFERQQVVALLEAARSRLIDLDAANARLETGTYGTCEECGETISPDRLSARPSTRTCVGCAMKDERARRR
jgi:RNA polymerase-binding transcription factor DksA